MNLRTWTCKNCTKRHYGEKQLHNTKCALCNVFFFVCFFFLCYDCDWLLFASVNHMNHVLVTFHKHICVRFQMFVTSIECLDWWNVLRVFLLLLSLWLILFLINVLSVTVCHLRCWLGFLLPSLCISHEEDYEDLGCV